MTEKLKSGFRAAAVALALVWALALPAAADDYTGDTDRWKVWFNGDELKSTFAQADWDDMIWAMQPGDEVVFTLTLSNDSRDTTDWYMKNEVLESLEQSQAVARYGAYSYYLAYTNVAGDVRVLYDSDTVGGTKTEEPRLTGLHEATDSLKDWLFLDELVPSAHGTIVLKVGLEGETQGNGYQDTLARLQMQFAVETIENSNIPGVTPTPGPGITPGPNPTPSEKPDATPTPTPTTTNGPRISPTPRVIHIYQTAVPQTGDSQNPMLIALVCGVSGLLLLALALYRLRKAAARRKEQDEEK